MFNCFDETLYHSITLGPFRNYILMNENRPLKIISIINIKNNKNKILIKLLLEVLNNLNELFFILFLLLCQILRPL